MSSANPYQEHAINTASPAQLVLMLFDGVLTAMGKARAADSAAQTADVAVGLINRELQRAQDIIMELQLSLDLERGGQIAASLDGLYGFCIDQLIHANVRKDLSLLQPVEQVIRDLRDAWEAACCGTPVASAAG